MVQSSLTAWLKKAKVNFEEVSLPAVLESAVVSPQHVQNHVAEAETRKGQDEDTIEGPTGDAIVEETSESASNMFDKSLILKDANLSPNASLATITADTLPAFRRMTALLLPVPYPDKFYKEILTDDVASNVSMVALWADGSGLPRLVAGIRCRIISHPAGTSPLPSLYVSTVTTLAPFRGHGLARALLRHVTARAIELYHIGTVTAHNWEGHAEAKGWYEQLGFKVVKYEKDYYRKLKPGGAYLFEKVVGPRDLLGEG
jgi:ribosomal protein S18 acetylase RimI-like enzyme